MSRDIPALDAEKYRSQLIESANAHRIPLAGSIELTARCNLLCKHCYIREAAHDQRSIERELTRGGLWRLLDQMAEAGCLWLTFTGGEPLLRDDFLDIYLYAKRKGILITLFTNGTQLTPRIAEVLAECPPRSIEITLYGRTKQTYERVTGVHGSYDRCMQGIDLILDKGLPLKLKSMIMTLNVHELQEMKTFAKDRGVDFRFDAVLNPRLDGSKSPLRYRLSPEDVVGLERSDEDVVRELRTVWKRFIGKPSHRRSLYFCGVGRHSFHVDAVGMLVPCIVSRNPARNLRRRGFQEAWLELAREVRGLKRTKKSVCQECNFAGICRNCPGTARLEVGDEELFADYVCRLTQLQANGILNITPQKETTGYGEPRQEEEALREAANR